MFLATFLLLLGIGGFVYELSIYPNESYKFSLFRFTNFLSFTFISIILFENAKNSFSILIKKTLGVILVLIGFHLFGSVYDDTYTYDIYQICILFAIGILFVEAGRYVSKESGEKVKMVKGNTLDLP